MPSSMTGDKAESPHGAVGAPPIGGAQETSKNVPYRAEARIGGKPLKPLIYRGVFPV